MDTRTVKAQVECSRCEGDCVVQGALGLKECPECAGRGEVTTWIDVEA